MADNLTPEEDRVLTGAEPEDARDEEHPKGSLDEDMEGSGVDEPDISSASWDDEIEDEDREDFTAAKIKFEELTDEDRDIYLEMVALRDEMKEGSAEKEGREDLKELMKRCKNIKAELMDGSRPKFLDLMIKKLEVL